MSALIADAYRYCVAKFLYWKAMRMDKNGNPDAVYVLDESHDWHPGADPDFHPEDYQDDE